MSEETTNNYLYKKRVQLLAFNMGYLRTRGLKDAHTSLIIVIESFRQSEEELPYPSNLKVAERMGTSEKTVRRRSQELQKMGLVRRPKGGVKPVWDFENLYKLLENKKKEALKSLNEATKDKSPYGSKKASNPLKNKPLTSSSNSVNRCPSGEEGNSVISDPQLGQNETLTRSTGVRLKIKTKRTNNLSVIKTLRANLAMDSKTNWFEKEKESDSNFSLKKQKQKSSKAKGTLKKKTLLQKVLELYDNLPIEKSIEQIVQALAEEAVDQFLVMKEIEIRSKHKVFYHRVDQRTLTRLVLEDFPYRDIPEGFKKRKLLVLTISKRAWRTISSCLKNKIPFPLIASKNERSKNPVLENINGKKIPQCIGESLNNGNDYIGDPPREEAKRILRSLQNGNGSNGNHGKNPLAEKEKPVSLSVPNGEIPIDEMKRFYSSLHDKGKIKPVIKILVWKSVELFSIAKKPDGRKVDLDYVTNRVLKIFPQDMPLAEPERGNYLILNVCKIVTKILTNTGKEDTSFGVRESVHSENGNGVGTNGHGAGDKAQEQRNQGKGKPMHSLEKSPITKSSNGNGHNRVSDAKLHKAFHSLSWYQKFKEARSSIN